jgi:rhodanese-related sulfurtransferase
VQATTRSAIDELLDRSRQALCRVSPCDLDAEVAAGALVVDIRPVEQRTVDGVVPGAVVIDRNVLEWRLTPTSETRIEAIHHERRVILICNEGFSSSLAAAALQSLGLRYATDLEGGFQALQALRRTDAGGAARAEID